MTDAIERTATKAGVILVATVFLGIGAFGGWAFTYRQVCVESYRLGRVEGYSEGRSDKQNESPQSSPSIPSGFSAMNYYDDGRALNLPPKPKKLPKPIVFNSDEMAWSRPEPLTLHIDTAEAEPCGPGIIHRDDGTCLITVTLTIGPYPIACTKEASNSLESQVFDCVWNPKPSEVQR